jgi:chromate reductase, NAD(P)H dehydrogenase (quinone)
VSDVLLISGSVRAGSSNQAVLNTAAAVAPAGVRTTFFEGLRALPHFNPDDDHDPLPLAVADLRGKIAAADALLFCVPEYAGALPGSLKNLLDWTVGGVETSDKPTGWINISTSGGGAAGAHAELATVLRYTDARLVEAACVHIPVGRQQISEDGLVTDPQIREAVADVLAALVDSR